MDILWINFGGSHCKLARTVQLLEAKFGDEFRRYGSRMSGHWTNQQGIIPDTPDNRAWVKAQPGITVSRAHAKSLNRQKEVKKYNE